MSVAKDDPSKAGSINPNDFIARDETQGQSRWNGMADGWQPDAEDYEKVDLETGDRALRIAMETRQVGAETLARLKEQAEQLDRIERNVLETENNLDRGDRILDGMSSFGGQLKNLVTPDRYKNKYGAYEGQDRTVQLEDQERFTDVPILMKHSNDYLEAALLRFGDHRFHCVDTSHTKVKNYDYSYDQVSCIIMRARHQHVDIRFHDGTERFRCCTSFVQAVVNEIVLRTKPGQVVVIHEPGTKKFQYGSLAIREQTLQASRDNTWSAEGGFFQAPKANSAGLVSNAPDEIQMQLKMQDDQINTLSNVVGDIRTMNKAIKKEADRETEQLDKVHERTNKALHKANKDVHRTDRLL